MKIEDIRDILTSFLKQEDSYTSVLIDGKWGCGKTTQIRKCIEEVGSRNIIYVSLFGIKSINDLSPCYVRLGKAVKNAMEVASIGISVIPIVGQGISNALSNVLDQYNDSKTLKKKKVFVFDDLERVDDSMSLIPLLGFFNNLMLKGCRILCLSALDEIKDNNKRNEFDRFVEKAFDRSYHIDEDPDEIFSNIFRDAGASNIKEVSKGFNGNIRLAKRTRLLFKNADDRANSIKSKEYDFYQNYSKEELLLSSMLAIRVLYVEPDGDLLTDKQKQSYLYALLEEQSKYFGEKVSSNYVREMMSKNYFQEDRKNSNIHSLTKDLLYIEMFNNYSFFEEDSRIIATKTDNEKYPLLSKMFYYLNDKDRNEYFDLLVQSIRQGEIFIDSALISNIEQVCTYSSLYLPDDVIDTIVNSIAEQVRKGQNSTYEKVKEQRSYVDPKYNNNCLNTIFVKSKQLIDNNKRIDAEKNLKSMYETNNYSALTDLYYELTEGKLFSERENYSKITVENNFFMPHLEKSITHEQWSFCHQVAKYCKTVNISDEFINYLKDYCNKYPSEESLKDKAWALIYYNIDRSFKIEDLL